MNTTQPETQAENCSVCGELPDKLIVNTGREQTFPAACYKLIPIGGQDSSQGMFSQLHRCPNCNAYFVWEEYPQMYGSGDNDEEHLIRISAEATAAVRNQGNSLSNDDVEFIRRAAENEASQARYAFNIMEKHFANAGAIMKHNDLPNDWSHFCLLFYLNTNELLEKGMLHAKLLTELLVELVEFIRAFSGKDFTIKLYNLLGDFDPRYSWLEPFLPESAQLKISTLEEMRLQYEDEAERIRLDQMSY